MAIASSGLKDCSVTLPPIRMVLLAMIGLHLFGSRIYTIPNPINSHGDGFWLSGCLYTGDGLYGPQILIGDQLADFMEFIFDKFRSTIF